MGNYDVLLVAAVGAGWIVAITWAAKRTLMAQQLRWQTRLDEALTEKAHLLEHVHDRCQCHKYRPKDWYRQKAAAEGDLEVGAGMNGSTAESIKVRFQEAMSMKPRVLELEKDTDGN